MSSNTESRLSSAVASTGTSTRTRYTTARSGALVEVVVWWIRAWRSTKAAAVLSVAWVRATLTPVGWLSVITLVAGLTVGIALGWVELIVAAGIAGLLLFMSIPFLFGAGSYDVDLHLTDDRVVAGSQVRGAIKVVNSSRYAALPGRLDIPIGRGILDIHLPLLRSGHEYDEEIVVPAERRGVIRVGPVTTVRGDPLGVLKREVLRAELSEVFVHPVTTAIPSTSAGFIKDLEGNPTSEIVNSDISFHAIREYAPGDSRRQIHWKSTAKTGTLMVRQFEETRRSRLAVILAVKRDEFGTDDEFEMAISAAGSIGVRAIRDGRELEVVSSTEIPEFVRDSVRSITNFSTLTGRALLDALSAVDATAAAMPIEEVCSLAAQASSDISIAFVMVGSPVTLRRLQAAALKFPLGTSVVAVVCNPEAEPSIRIISSLTVMTIGVLDDLRHLMARASA